MDDVSLFSDETLLALRRQIEQYPSFPIVKILYLKNLAVLNSPDFLSELERLSIAIPDRRKLFLLIEDRLDDQSSLTMSGNQERDNAFDLIDLFLSDRGEKGTGDWDKTVLGASVSSDYLFWSMANHLSGKEETAQKETLPSDQQQLIDSFLETERPGRFVSISQNEEEEKVVAEEPESSWSQDDSFFTETLAQIYIKQKRYERALQIIEKLSLKYPEKNVYFADQIRFLEKLIINNKNIK
ncbi:MAG: hypothetical protein PHG27_08135 [Massilibacteroides sp.]|nr:hypothetical protein [Massilibacteroides sp.]MDD4115546.1 hypothetical protein [Massilibacteroides sp.]MDD4660642.1 hypothetical protein [Massilibacteroides sp.]